MITRRAVIIGGFGAALPAAGYAAQIQELQVLSGDKFAAGGGKYRLADIIAPSFYSLGDKTNPFANRSRDIFARLSAGKRFELTDVTAPTRWGERVVTARPEGASQTLQELLVGAGASRVLPESDDLKFIEKLLDEETQARQARRGLWRLAQYAVLDSHDIGKIQPGFQIVHGIVLRTARTAARFYLNFGEDYRTDFTATIPMPTYRKMNGEHLESLGGKAVRVRGFVRNINGPSIEITHPGQLEHL